MPPLPARQRAIVNMASAATRETPLIFEEWYVAAFGHEIVLGDLLARRVLGRDIVLFRDAEGRIRALDDRCAHRSFPLSAGRWENGEIVCGYHGIRYSAAGECTAVPALAVRPPHIGIRKYACEERGDLIWIWMGHAEEAAGAPPTKDWMSDPGWSRLTTSLFMRANYVGLHENLLDLTHIEYLHARTLGANSPGFAAAPYETHLSDSHFALQRSVVPTGLPDVFARTTGLADTRTAARVSRSEFISPGYEQITARYFDAGLPEGRPEYCVETAHLITPESQYSTHYFVLHGWNFGQGDPQVARLMHEGLLAAFEEDVRGLEKVDQVLAARAASPDFYEMSIATDAASLAMRRHLKRRAEAEHISASRPTNPSGEKP